MLPTLLSQKSRNKYYDAWEFMPEEKRRVIQAENLAKYVAFAREHCAWYRPRLEAYSASAEHPLAGVPILESNDLRELLPPKSNALVTCGSRDYTVFQSGGTTGFPKTALFGHHELERLNLPNARGFFALGLEEIDRVANLFAVGGLYMTFVHINRMLQQYGCQNFPFSNHTPADFVRTVTQLFNINVFTGISSVVLDCLRAIAAQGVEGIHIEKVFYGGEHLYEADKQELREKFGTKVIAAPGYGTVDTWYLGYQCLACPTGYFHAHDDEVHLEIVNEESGKHCAPGEVGMLYATAYARRVTPIIRYRVGDRARWMAKGCDCGRTTPLFELLGRGDDVLRIGYDSIDYNAIQEAVTRIPGMTGTIQMQKERIEGRDRLTVRIETETPTSEHARLADALQHEIVDKRPSFRDFIKKGTVWPLVVELKPIGTIARNPRTGKLMRVVDAL